MTRFVVSSAAIPTTSKPTSSRVAPSSRSSASRSRAHAEEPEPEDVIRHREEAVRELTRRTPRHPRARSDSMATSECSPRGLASVDVLPLVLVRLRHPVLPVLVRVGARRSFHLVPEETEVVSTLCPGVSTSAWSPSCSALLLLPSCFRSHPRCLFPNISPTEGRGCYPGEVAVTPKVSVTKVKSHSRRRPPKVDFTKWRMCRSA